jgi:hypothetical protein
MSIVTVIDRVPFTASVSPEQAAAYVRCVLPTWREVRGEVWWLFSEPGDAATGQIALPAATHWRDYSRSVRWACEELVALGIVSRPSEALRAMAAEEPAGAIAR